MGKSKSIAELTAELKAAKANAKAAKAKGKRKRTKLPVANFTDAVSVETRPESREWAVEHVLLRFHDKDGVALAGPLDPEDEIGQGLYKEIKAYAAANPQGNSRIRFDTKLKPAAWKGRVDMFPPRLLVIAGFEPRK